MSLISPEIGQIPTSPPFLSVIAQSIMWRSIRYSIAWYLPEAALASFRHRVAKIQHAGQNSGAAGSIARLALAKMSLNISIDSLQGGHAINCNSLDEVLGAEEAIKDACESLKTYLDIAETFDGRQEVIEY